MLVKLIRALTGYTGIEKQLNVIYKDVAKMGKYMETLHKEIAIYKTKSKELDDRLSIIEGFMDNIEKISTEYMKDIAN